MNEFSLYLVKSRRFLFAGFYGTLGKAKLLDTKQALNQLYESKKEATGGANTAAGSRLIKQKLDTGVKLSDNKVK